MNNLKPEKCISVKEYIIEIIEVRRMAKLYYNRIINDIISGQELTEGIAKELEKLFNINYKIFLNIDNAYKIEQRYLKRKRLQKIKKENKK